MSSLEQFRQLTGGQRAESGKVWKPPVTLRERLIVGALLLQFLWLAICMGGVNLWAQHSSVAIAVVTFLLLALPLPGESANPLSRQPRAVILRLLKFPPFWLGFGLMVYVWIQSWNTEWIHTFVPPGTGRMIRQDYIEWLPSGIIAPLEQSNPYRGMLYILVPWLSICTLWAGVQSRRALSFLLQAIAVVFLAWGLAALYQHYTGMNQILGIWETHPRKASSSVPFWGTLVNENHGAFFLVLGTGLCQALFLGGLAKAAREFRFGGLYLLHFGFALLLSFAAAQAESRGATGMIIVLWMGFLLICSYFFVRFYALKGALFPIGIFAVFLVFVFISIANPDRYERLKRSYERTVSLSDNPELEGRYYMLKVTNAMIADRPWLGYGAGSFRYIHLRYASPYAELAPNYRVRVVDSETGRRVWRSQPYWFRQAHLDLSEFVIEWGIIGSSFVFLAWLWGLGVFVRYWRYVDYGQIALVWGGFVLILGAAWEFHFRAPLLPFTWTLLMIIAVKTVWLRAPSKESR